jgi:hypothetical protein
MKVDMLFPPFISMFLALLFRAPLLQSGGRKTLKRAGLFIAQHFFLVNTIFDYGQNICDFL